MEIWDTYYKDGSLSPIKIKRGDPIPEGLYTLAAEALIRHKNGRYLCMMRSTKKAVFPGYLETSVGGAALSGETPVRCIRREALEECGIDLLELTQIGYDINEERRHIIYSYLSITDADMDSVVLQENETEGYVWMNESEFAAFVNSGKMIPTQRARLLPFFKKCGFVD